MSEADNQMTCRLEVPNGTGTVDRCRLSSSSCLFASEMRGSIASHISKWSKYCINSRQNAHGTPRPSCSPMPPLRTSWVRTCRLLKFRDPSQILWKVLTHLGGDALLPECHSPAWILLTMHIMHGAQPAKSSHFVTSFSREVSGLGSSI